MPTLLLCYLKKKKKNQKPPFPLQVNLEKKQSTWWPQGQLHLGIQWRGHQRMHLYSQGMEREQALTDPTGSHRWAVWQENTGHHDLAFLAMLSTTWGMKAATETPCPGTGPQEGKMGNIPEKNTNKAEAQTWVPTWAGALSGDGMQVLPLVYCVGNDQHQCWLLLRRGSTNKAEVP